MKIARKKQVYIHELYTVHICNGKEYPGEKVTVIKGKKRFKEMLKNYFYKEDIFGIGKQRLCFRLTTWPDNYFMRIYAIPLYGGTIGFAALGGDDKTDNEKYQEG